MRLFKNKWILFLIIIVCFVVIDMQVKNITLAQRGIVLGIGIDKDGEEYIVTSEILAPSNLGAENYQKNRLVSIQRGKTLEEAFEKMDKALGVRVSLRHTVLIVLGDSMLKGGDYAPLIDLFVGNDVADSTYIIGTFGDAKSLFDANPPLYSTISYKIAETFRSPDIESGVVATNIKDFFKMYLSESGAIYIPLVEIGKGDMTESNGGGEEQKSDSIDFGRIAILDTTGQKLILNREESEGLSYIYSNVNEANLYVESDKDRVGFDVDIIDTLATRKYDVENNKVTIDIKMWIKIGSQKSTSKDDYISPVDGDKRELAGETIKKAVRSAYLACHEKGVDILGIANGFYKKQGKEYKKLLGDNYLEKIVVDIRLKLIIK